MTKSVNNMLFMNLKGIDRVEALWYNQVRGTQFLQHPVSRVRAKNFLATVQQCLS